MSLQRTPRQFISLRSVPKFEKLPMSQRDKDALKGNISDVVTHLSNHFGSNPIGEKDATLSPIPYDTTSRKGFVQPEGIDPKGWSHVVDLNGRKTVMVKAAGRHIPFYLSTGMGGKFTSSGASTEGMWLPMMGIHHESGWINKGSGVDSHYGSPHLQQIGAMLTKHFAQNPIGKAPMLSAGSETDVRGLGPGNGGPESITHRFINSAMKFRPIYGEMYKRVG